MAAELQQTQDRGVRVTRWFTDERGRRRPIVERPAPIRETSEVPATPSRLGRRRVAVVEPEQLTFERQDIPIEAIWPDPEQHRKLFDQAKLRELAESIEQVGLLEPIVVRSKPGPDGEAYQIIAGERRWRACQMIGRPTIEAHIRDDLNDIEARRLQVIENLQREDVTDVEEARAYAQLRDEYKEARLQEPAGRKLSDDELDDEARDWTADQVSKPPKRVTYYLKLDDMPASIKESIEGGRLTIGHAAALARLTEGVTDADTLAHRQDMIVNLGRHAAADGIGKRALDKLVTQVLGQEAQAGMFGEGELTAPAIGRAPATAEARQVASQQKHELEDLFDTMVRILGKTWDEREQQFRADVFTDNELDIYLSRINGCLKSLEGLADAFEAEARFRELQTALAPEDAAGEATKAMGVTIHKGVTVGHSPVSSMEMFAPFTKIDPLRQYVEGVATSEAWDAQNEQMAWPGIMKAVSEYQHWRNVRSMHEKQAVGTAPLLRLNMPDRQVIIGAHIVDPLEWEKVAAEVYKGFSIGGKKRATEKAHNPHLDTEGTRITAFDWLETSLVDRPANPEAVFVLVKRSPTRVVVRERTIGGAS